MRAMTKYNFQRPHIEVMKDMKNIQFDARDLDKTWKHQASGRESFVLIKKVMG